MDGRKPPPKSSREEVALRPDHTCRYGLAGLRAGAQARDPVRLAHRCSEAGVEVRSGRHDLGHGPRDEARRPWPLELQKRALRRDSGHRPGRALAVEQERRDEQHAHKAQSGAQRGSRSCAIPHAVRLRRAGSRDGRGPMSGRNRPMSGASARTSVRTRRPLHPADRSPPAMLITGDGATTSHDHRVGAAAVCFLRLTKSRLAALNRESPGQDSDRT